jgi:hypothetical protein
MNDVIGGYICRKTWVNFVLPDLFLCLSGRGAAYNVLEATGWVGHNYTDSNSCSKQSKEETEGRIGGYM